MPRTFAKILATLVLLSACGGHHHREGWDIKGNIPDHTYEMISVAPDVAAEIWGQRKEEWGELVIVDKPFLCGKTLAVGCTYPFQGIAIVYAKDARDTALPWELCNWQHALIFGDVNEWDKKMIACTCLMVKKTTEKINAEVGSVP